MIRSTKKLLQIVVCFAVFSSATLAQSGHSARNLTSADGTILSVVAERTDGKTDPIKLENLYLYENGIEQKIRNFSYDPSPSRIVLLVDNSQTLPANIEALKKATMEFAYEIYDGDQLFVIGYDTKAEIIQEWTDDAEKIETALSTFRKEGNPYLFDAIDITISEVLAPLMPGTRKTAIVVISDGLDRGSKKPFEKVLDRLQQQNIVVYTIQMPDRTGGAYRRNQPKAREVVKQLSENTGGKAFSIEEAQTAAKYICDELRKNRYLLSYFPTNTSSYDHRRVFLIADEGIQVRTKTAQPPNVK
ncbi:MAG: VWA domain-containing protein [Pyrinomonadaceae bacterium]|nr:VWA domain-containing protein [Pyrinomonadaceae bacterium]